VEVAGQNRRRYIDRRVLEDAMLARQIVIGFGLAIIFPLLVYYGVSTFHPAPRTQHYFGNLPPFGTTPEERRARDEAQRAKQAEYNAAAKSFARTLVMVATPLGVAAILIGAFASPYWMGTGLILGGILTVGSGYYFYWQYLEDWLRFISLLAGFVVLIFVGYWRLTPPRAAPHA
jgi:hypothetical protein